VGFAIQHTIALLNRGLSDGLSQVAFPGASGTEEQSIFALADERGCRLRFILGLKAKSKLSRVRWAPHIAACLLAVLPDTRKPDALADGARKEYMESVPLVSLLIIDDFGMRQLPPTGAEDLLEIVMRRYELASTLLTSNRPGGRLGQTAGRSWTAKKSRRRSD
jgi:hypothetical protein